MTARRLRAPERRAQLLDVLERVVLSDGFAGVNIDRVAREGGIARTVVYAQFSPEGAPPVIRARIEQGRAAIRELVEPLVAWGIEARGGPEGLDPELFTRVLISLGEDAARLTLSDPVRYPPERMETWSRALLSSIRWC